MKKNRKEINVLTVCPFCHKEHEIGVNFSDYCEWEEGALVQHAFPYLSADEREMLISGICPDCWESMFGGEDTPEEEEESPEDWEIDESFFDGIPIY